MLLIISNKNFSNSYQLCKVLSWRFDIINCSEIITRVERRNLVDISYPVSKTLEHFSLTTVGKQLLTEESLSLAKILKVEFSGQIDFINNLLSIG